MKKEKTIRTYQRRTKTGKVVTVKQHTAKYDAAEALKEAAKKKGAGDELEKLKKKMPVGETSEEEEYEKLVNTYLSDTDDSTRERLKKSMLKEFKKAKSKEERKELFDDVKESLKVGREVKRVKAANKKFAASLKAERDYGFTADDYKAWYHWDQDADPKNKSALKVEKALKKQMGTKGYKKYFDEMSDSYSARGHNKAFKGLSDTLSAGEKKSVTPTKETKTSKGGFDNERSFSQNFPRELRQYVDSKNFSLKKKPTKAIERAFNDAGFEIRRNDVEGIWEPTRNGMRYKEIDWSAKNKAERAEKSDVVKWARDNGYSLRRDGTFQLKADAKKSRYEIYTLKDLEAKMGKKSVTPSKENMPKKSKSTAGVTGTSWQKLMDSHKSSDLDVVDKLVKKLSTKKAVRKLPKNMAYHYQYSVGGEGASETIARKVLSAMPKKYYQEFLDDFNKTGGSNIHRKR